MIDHVLVTVASEKQRHDMELPVKMPVGELKEKLLEILKEAEPKAFQGKSQIDLIFEEYLLSDEKTLEESYVWDGCIISVK